MDNQWDKSIANLIIKTSTGITIGIAFSLLVFKRIGSIYVGKAWPIALTTGFGAGMAYAESTKSFSIWNQ